MSGYCDDCGNTLCVCAAYNEALSDQLPAQRRSAVPHRPHPDLGGRRHSSVRASGRDVPSLSSFFVAEIARATREALAGFAEDCPGEGAAEALTAHGLAYPPDYLDGFAAGWDTALKTVQRMFEEASEK